MSSAKFGFLIHQRKKLFCLFLSFSLSAVATQSNAQVLDYYYIFQSTDTYTEITNDVTLFSGTYYWIIEPLEGQQGEGKSGFVMLLRD